LQCIKFPKNENFEPLTKHGTHWINFIILTFISEIIDTLDAYIKFEVNLFHLTKKKGNLRQVIGFMKKKWIWVLGVSPYVSNGVPQRVWTKSSTIMPNFIFL
jgi:hypothetical protein